MFSGKLFEYVTRKAHFGKTNERLDTPLAAQRGPFEKHTVASQQGGASGLRVAEGDTGTYPSQLNCRRGKEKSPRGT